MVLVIDYRDIDKYKDQITVTPIRQPVQDPLTERLLDEAKSWQQLQKERDAIVEAEVVKTKNEADEMANRARMEDKHRTNAIQMERERVENAEKTREMLMKTENEERVRRDLERKETIKRQSDLLAGRTVKPKTQPCGPSGPIKQGIQVLHYKDPAVTEIMKNTSVQEVLQQSMIHKSSSQGSHQSLLHRSPSQGPASPNTPTRGPGSQAPMAADKSKFFSFNFGEVSTGQVQSTTNEYKNVMDKKESVFKKGAINRSESSASSHSTVSR